MWLFIRSQQEVDSIGSTQEDKWVHSPVKDGDRCRSCVPVRIKGFDRYCVFEAAERLEIVRVWWEDINLPENPVDVEVHSSDSRI